MTGLMRKSVMSVFGLVHAPERASLGVSCLGTIMSIGPILLDGIERCAIELVNHPLMRRAEQGNVAPSTVARYLSSVHYLVRHTPPHLQLALDSARRNGDAQLVNYFERKLEEEQGHDRWAEADIAELSQKFALASVPEPSLAMKALVAFVEARLRSEPASYVVYVLFAEYITVLVGPTWTSALQRHCGIPIDALSVVTRHAILDQDHVASALSEIEPLLARANPERMLEMLEQSIRHFREFCDDLARSETEPPNSVAA